MPFLVPVAASLALEALHGGALQRAYGVVQCLIWAAAQPQRQMRTASVASLRLDAVLAAMLQVSRTQAVQCVRSGAVSVNHVPMQSAHAGCLKMTFSACEDMANTSCVKWAEKAVKGRTIVSYFQY